MRVVKPGGRICLVDTDLDCTAVYSKNPALARKMTSIVAASMPNANSGRELPALARQASLKDVQTVCSTLTTPYEFFVLVMTGALSKAVEDGVVPRAEEEDGVAEEGALHARGECRQLWFMVLVSGTV